ncbi:nucleotidyltransferase-like protein [Calidifontibacillus oryziterrae]|uniref:nucleotidyltransferase-like protein n=1 Tax=Calidifontibacillus oryziterrae TaxID=1191699 RepID=UPI0002EAF448|nr:nucleotidyltransferase-like protein [Calidifontibacillus oryziterrae]
MDELLRPIYEERVSRSETLGVLLLEKAKANSPLTDNFDTILIVIEKNMNDEGPMYEVEHYNIDEKKVAFHIINENQFNEWLANGSNRRLLYWVLDGTVLFERNQYIEALRNSILQFPVMFRKRKIVIEFAKLIRSWSNGKDLYERKQYLDAYNQMVLALHHLARLSVIEHGFYPEVTVWKQVKKIEPEVYKLYMELVESTETIEEKVELLLLASEFAISSRARIGSSFIVDIMKSKEEPWTIAELMQEKSLEDFNLDVGLLLQYLVSKNIVRVINEGTKSNNIYQRKYIVS